MVPVPMKKHHSYEIIASIIHPAPSYESKALCEQPDMLKRPPVDDFVYRFSFIPLLKSASIMREDLEGSGYTSVAPMQWLYHDIFHTKDAQLPSNEDWQA
jgi:hypothetical protein